MGGIIPSPLPARQLAAAVREQLQWFEAGRPLRDTCRISSGCEGLDRLLPAGGLVRGSLVECLGDGPCASGAGALAMLLARRAIEEGGVMVVLDHQHGFYPPAAACWGVDLKDVVVVRAFEQRDRLWAVDQALRCSAVAAVWAPWDQLDERDFRRLQLAAEVGGGVGFLVRSHRFHQRPSWSNIRLMIYPQVVGAGELGTGRRLRIEVTRYRGGQEGGSVEVQIDEVTGVMRQVSSRHEALSVYPTAQLAHSASGGRSA